MWRERITERIGRLHHPAWGPAHCERLYATARDIIEAEGLACDDDVLFAVAWLHDIGTFEEFPSAYEKPPDRAAEAARTLLSDAGFPADRIPLVQQIIREHSFEGQRRDNVEARVVRDADMLEFLGAIGIVRLLSLVEVEPWVREPGGALSLAQEFSRALPERLEYARSRELAETRVAESEAFMRALDAETNHLAWI